MMMLRRLALLLLSSLVTIPYPLLAETANETAAAAAPDTNDVASAAAPAAENKLLAEARAMLANPEKYKPEDWQSLSERLENSIPETSAAQQKLALEVVDARREGRTHESIQPLIRQQQELEQQIKTEIENLPEITALIARTEQLHRDLLDTIKLRQQIQKYVNPDAPTSPARLPAGSQRSQ